tara:strand:+ start:489 stop:641 length:153 start_codon:yes stop_codon:yes gene_type:complete
MINLITLPIVLAFNLCVVLPIRFVKTLFVTVNVMKAVYKYEKTKNLETEK